MSKLSVTTLTLSLVMTILVFGQAQATEVPASLVYQGRIIKPDSTPLEAASVTFTLQILSPGSEACLLYEETQTIPMTDSKGVFALKVGQGARTVNDPGLSMAALFSNAAPLTGLTCSSGTSFDPATNKSRLLKSTFFDGSQTVAISPAYEINSVPYALYAQTLEGKSKDEFVQTSTNITQSNIETLVGGTNASSLHKHDDLYLLKGGSGSQNLGSGISYSTGKIGIGSSTPTADLQINQADPEIRLSASTGGGGNNKVSFYSGTTERARIESSEAQADLKFMTGGSTALSLDSNQNATFAGSVTSSGFIKYGAYTTIQETDLVTNYLTACGAACRGATWVNSDTQTVRYWNSTAVQSVASFGGSYTNGGVMYSTASGLAITAAGTSGQVLTSSGAGAPVWASVSDSGKLPLAGGTMSGTINMGSQSIVNLLDPSNAQDAATKNYCDANLAGRTVDMTGLADGQSIKWNATQSKWVAFTPGGSGVTSVGASGVLSSTGGATPSISLNIGGGLENASGDLTVKTGSGLELSSGAVAVKYGDGLTVASGTLKVDKGSGAGQLLAVDAVPNCTSSQKLQMSAGPVFALTCVADQAGVTSVATGTGLVSTTITSTGSIAVDVGTGANQIVQLNGSAALPAVSGANLTNVDASTLKGRAVASTAPTNGQVLAWNSTNTNWEPQTASAGSTNATTLQSRDVASTAPTDGQLLAWNNTNSRWEPKTVSSGGGSGGITGCPSGMTLVTADAANGYSAFCIDTAMNAAARWGVAHKTCALARKYLCHYNEFMRAKDVHGNAVGGSDQSWVNEWFDISSNDVQNGWLMMSTQAAGSGEGSNFNQTKTFLCCRR